MNQHDHLDAFDFTSVISAAGTALKAGLPNLVQAGIQKRMAEINAKRAQKIQAAQERQAAAMAPREPAYQPEPTYTPRPTGMMVRGTAPAPSFFQTLPAWVIPAVIALIVALLKFRAGKKK